MNAHDKMLTAIANHPEATISELSRITGLSEGSVQSNRSELRSKGLIVCKPKTGSAELIAQEINRGRAEDEPDLEVKWAITGKGRSRINELHRKKIEEVLKLSEALSMPWFRPPAQGSEPEDDKKQEVEPE